MSEPDQPDTERPEFPESATPSAEDPGRFVAGRTRAIALAVDLVLVAVLAIGCGIWLLADPPPTPEENEYTNRQHALAAADRFASTLVSFDATKPDSYLDALKGMLGDDDSGPCMAEVAKLVPAVGNEAAAKSAASRKQEYLGEVRQRAIELIDSDSARALVVVAYQMTAIVDDKRVPLAAQDLRLRIDLETDAAGDWLVNSCPIVVPSQGGDQ